MLFKGTQQRPTALDVSAAIEGLGGVLNAETGKEATVYWAKVSRPHASKALEVLADIILASRFEPDEIEKERKVIIEELNMVMDLPQDWVDILFDHVLWGDQPLGWDIGGTKSSIEAITRTQLLSFLGSKYTPNNAVVSIAGATTHQELVEEIAVLLNGWKPDAPRHFQPTTGPAQHKRLQVENRQTEQAHLCLGVPGLSYQHPDRFTIDLANVILGEGMSSRLFQNIRENMGLAYDVHSYVNHYRDAGALLVYAGVDPQRIEQSLGALIHELEALTNSIEADELGRCKEFWKGRMQLRLEDTRAYASWMGGQELLLDRILTLDEVMDKVDAITAEDIKRVMGEMLNENQLRLAVIGPFPDEKPFAKILGIEL
jgi:predicted Zn-dependent peptidase